MPLGWTLVLWRRHTSPPMILVVGWFYVKHFKWRIPTLVYRIPTFVDANPPHYAYTLNASKSSPASNQGKPVSLGSTSKQQQLITGFAYRRSARQAVRHAS